MDAILRGFVVVESPFEFEALFPGTNTPDSVEIDGVVFESDSAADWRVTRWIELDPGVNPIHVVVMAGGDVVGDHAVPITYVPGGEVQLVSIVAADAATVTVDYLYWEGDQEFPGPMDDHPGELHTLAVDPNVLVVVDEAIPFDYAWLVDRVTVGEPTQNDDWIPEYPYWVTTVDDIVVQIWIVPLG